METGRITKVDEGGNVQTEMKSLKRQRDKSNAPTLLTLHVSMTEPPPTARYASNPPRFANAIASLKLKWEFDSYRYSEGVQHNNFTIFFLLKTSNESN